MPRVYGVKTPRVLALLRMEPSSTYKEIAQRLRYKRTDLVRGVAHRYKLATPARRTPIEARTKRVSKKIKKTAGASYYKNGKPVRTPEELNELTAVESIVLHTFLENGYCNEDLAKILGMSTETIKRHFTHILEKTGYGTRSELAVNYLHKLKQQPAVPPKR